MRLWKRKPREAPLAEEELRVTLVAEEWGYGFKSHQPSIEHPGNWKVNLRVEVAGVGSAEAYCEYLRGRPGNPPANFCWRLVRSTVDPSWHDTQFEHSAFPVETFTHLLMLSGRADAVTSALIAERLGEELSWVEKEARAAANEQPFGEREATPAWDDFQARARRAERELSSAVQAWGLE